LEAFEREEMESAFFRRVKASAHALNLGPKPETLPLKDEEALAAFGLTSYAANGIETLTLEGFDAAVVGDGGGDGGDVDDVKRRHFMTLSQCAFFAEVFTRAELRHIASRGATLVDAVKGGASLVAERDDSRPASLFVVVAGETASHTTPFAWCTPFLKDFPRFDERS
jgi:hypothetical protein